MAESDGRHMEAYQCRLTRKMKKLLFQQAAEENRTANKIINDALYIYFAMAKEQRQEWKKQGIKTVEAQIMAGQTSLLDTMSTTRTSKNG